MNNNHVVDLQFFNLVLASFIFQKFQFQVIEEAKIYLIPQGAVVSLRVTPEVNDLGFKNLFLLHVGDLYGLVRKKSAF